MGRFIEVNDTMQRDYNYELVAPTGKDFDDTFNPFHTPQEMLAMGVFEGKYCNDCTGELPKQWFAHAKFSNTPDPSLNYFGIKSRQPLSVWRQKGCLLYTSDAADDYFWV